MVEIIQILGGRAKIGRVGSIFVGSVKSIRSNPQLAASQGKNASAINSKIQRVRKGEVVHGVIVQTKSPIQRKDGSMLKFNENCCVLVTGVGNAKSGIVPRGTRISTAIAQELRDRNMLKVLSLAPMAI